jgi:hypothetical protein
MVTCRWIEMKLFFSPWLSNVLLIQWEYDLLHKLLASNPNLNVTLQSKIPEVKRSDEEGLEKQPEISLFLGFTLWWT